MRLDAKTKKFEQDQEKEKLVDFVRHSKECNGTGVLKKRQSKVSKTNPALDAKWMEEGDLANSPQVLKLYLKAFGMEPTS